MKRIIIIMTCFLLLIMTGCSKKEEKSIKTLEDVLKENNYIVIDVRTKEEYDTGHVKDSLNIPYDEIEESIDLDKSKPILVYCRSGKRSNIAYQTLTSLGYEVFDLGAYDTVPLEKE